MFLRMMGLCLSLILKRDIFVELLHISQLVILEASILVDLNKGPSPTENVECMAGNDEIQSLVRIQTIIKMLGRGKWLLTH